MQERRRDKVPQAHLNGNFRNCGATTVVQNQSTVYVENQLWAVKNSFNSHGQGGLINTGGHTVFIEDKPVITHTPDDSKPDDFCPPDNFNHCNPKTAEGAKTVFAYK